MTNNTNNTGYYLPNYADSKYYLTVSKITRKVMFRGEEYEATLHSLSWFPQTLIISYRGVKDLIATVCLNDDGRIGVRILSSSVPHLRMSSSCSYSDSFNFWKGLAVAIEKGSPDRAAKDELHDLIGRIYVALYTGSATKKKPTPPKSVPAPRASQAPKPTPHPQYSWSITSVPIADCLCTWVANLRLNGAIISTGTAKTPRLARRAAIHSLSWPSLTQMIKVVDIDENYELKPWSTPKGTR